MSNWPWTEHWRFETTHFAVVLETAPEDDALRGHFADPAADQDVIDGIDAGTLAWFVARVRVELRDDFGDVMELAADTLGACCYASVDEFATSHRDADPMNRNCSLMRAANGANAAICHYFPDMVSQAIDAARTALDRRRDALARVRLRSAA